MVKTLTVRDLPETERPRERLLAYGAEALSSQELIALVLGRGIQGESVLLTAQKLLSQFGSLDGVLSASLEDLQKMRGLGVAKATQLKACLEIVRRVSNESYSVKLKSIISPKDVYKIVKSKITQYAKEHFFVLSFDVRNQFLGVDLISVGILNANLIHPRETFEVAIRRHAAQVIISHNHPSGQCEPSSEDVEITRTLVGAGKILGIEVIDHIIVCKNEYYSFADNGLL